MILPILGLAAAGAVGLYVVAKRPKKTAFQKAVDTERAAQGLPPARLYRPGVPTTTSAAELEASRQAEAGMVPGVTGYVPLAMIEAELAAEAAAARPGSAPPGAGAPVTPPPPPPSFEVDLGDTTQRAIQASKIGGQFGPWGAAGAFLSTYAQDLSLGAVQAVAGKEAAGSVHNVVKQFDPTQEGVAGDIAGRRKRPA